MNGQRGPGIPVPLLSLLAVLVVAAPACSGGAGDGAFYEGEEITLTVPYDTGGGTDITARFIAPLLESHIDGNPTIQVSNEPGANTLIGSNAYAAAEHDGMTLFMSGAATTFNYLLDNEDAKYSYADWKPVLASPQGNVVYVAPGLGVKEPRDLPNPSKPYVLPVQSVEGSDLVRILSLHLLGVKPKVVAGYEGGGPSRVAFEQGEANINGTTTSTYIKNVQPLVDKGDAVPMYSFGYIDEKGEVVRDPAAPELPHVGEVYESIHGNPPKGEMWETYKVLLKSYVMQKILWVHGDVPDEAITALRDGARSMLDDPEYKNSVDDVLEGYELVVDDELDRSVDEVMKPPKSALDWTYDYLRDEHDIDVRDH